MVFKYDSYVACVLHYCQLHCRWTIKKMHWKKYLCIYDVKSILFTIAPQSGQWWCDSGLIADSTASVTSSKCSLFWDFFYLFIYLFNYYLLTYWLTDWLTDCLPACLPGWLAGWLAGWLTDWLTDWLMN